MKISIARTRSPFYHSTHSILEEDNIIFAQQPVLCYLKQSAMTTKVPELPERTL